MAPDYSLTLGHVQLLDLNILSTAQGHTQNSSINSLSNSRLQHLKKQTYIHLLMDSNILVPICTLYSVGSHPGNLLKPLAVMSRVTCFIWWAHAENCIDQN